MVEEVVQTSAKMGLKKIAMSQEIMKAVLELREFLYDRVYLNPHAKGELKKTEKIITDLYHHILEHPDDYVKNYPLGDPLERRTADFIAGMTDRYALRLYERLFFPFSWSL